MHRQLCLLLCVSLVIFSAASLSNAEAVNYYKNWCGGPYQWLMDKDCIKVRREQS